MAGAISVDLTRSFYETNAETYAAATLGARMTSHHRDFVAALPNGAIAADLGCGSGRDLRALARAGLSPIGVDYSAPMARIARRTSGCPVVVSDMRDLPLRDGSVDGVWAAASLLHLPMQDLRIALNECRRILRRGGVFYASVKAGTGEGPDGDGRHFTFHSSPEWRRILCDAGLDPIRIGVGRERRVTAGRLDVVKWLSSMSLAV